MTAADREPAGRIHQVNVSPGGVPKRAVGRARVTRLGLEGDRQAHDSVHGGPHRAVALFALEAIERVRADGHPVVPGAVGENLTTIGIELARLPVGTRLAIGDEVVLEIAGPANPCDVIKGTFLGGKSGRISFLTHPDDSRMYARVLAEGEVGGGDPIRVLPAATGSTAATHALLDLLDSVEREAWLALWRAAAAAGFDVRVREDGDMAAAASPDLPGSIFNRVLGARQVPARLPHVLELHRRAGLTGWVVAAEPPFEDASPDWSPVGVHAAPLAVPEPPPVPGLVIREVGPDEALAWAATFVKGFEIQGPLAAAWPRLAPGLARSRGQHLFVAGIDGSAVAVAASFIRRRVAWLGAGTVLPAARGRGIQRALIAHRIARAAEGGARTVMATADVDSVSAANLVASGLPRVWTNRLYRYEPTGARPGTR